MRAPRDGLREEPPGHRMEAEDRAPPRRSAGDFDIVVAEEYEAAPRPASRGASMRLDLGGRPDRARRYPRDHRRARRRAARLRRPAETVVRTPASRDASADLLVRACARRGLRADVRRPGNAALARPAAGVDGHARVTGSLRVASGSRRRRPGGVRSGASPGALPHASSPRCGAAASARRVAPRRGACGPPAAHAGARRRPRGRIGVAGPRPRGTS